MKKILKKCDIYLVIYVLFVSVMILLSGCSAFESADDTIHLTDTSIREFSQSLKKISKSIDTVSSVMKEVNLTIRKVDTTVNNAPQLIDDAVTRLERIKFMLNDVLYMTDTTVGGIVGERTRMKLGLLRDELLGGRTGLLIKNLVESLLGYEARQKLTLLLDALKNNLFDEVTMQKLAQLREFLLGPETTQMLNTLMDNLSKNAARNIREEISPALHSEIDFVQQRAYWIITALVIAICVVAWFINKSKEKYSKIAKLLMYQISKLKDNPVFEELKNNISENAKQVGLEDELRALLEENGLLHLDKKP